MLEKSTSKGLRQELQSVQVRGVGGRGAHRCGGVRKALRAILEGCIHDMPQPPFYLFSINEHTPAPIAQSSLDSSKDELAARSQALEAEQGQSSKLAADVKTLASDLAKVREGGEEGERRGGAAHY